MYNNINLEFLELIDIDDIIISDELKNVYDIEVKDDNSFVLANGIISHNSALSGVKSGKNPKHHAIYPLRGKPINAYELSDKEVLEKQEFKNLMTIIGLNLGDNTFQLPDSDKWYSVKINNKEYIVNENDKSITIDNITYEL